VVLGGQSGFRSVIEDGTYHRRGCGDRSAAPRRINEIPGSDVLGVMTLRNRAMKVFDLRQRFGLSNPHYSLTTPIIAVNTSQGALGLVVDETDDVIQVAAENILPFSGDGVEGSFRIEGRMILIMGMGQFGPEKQP
jgi:chemotaxis signal transduction protein